MAYESRAETLTLSRELIETFIRNYVFFSIFNARASCLIRILIHPRDTWETWRDAPPDACIAYSGIRPGGLIASCVIANNYPRE